MIRLTVHHDEACVILQRTDAEQQETYAGCR